MAKVTISNPPPMYILELSNIEAHALTRLLGNLTDPEVDRILAKTKWKSQYDNVELRNVLTKCGHGALYHSLNEATTN